MQAKLWQQGGKYVQGVCDQWAITGTAASYFQAAEVMLNYVSPMMVAQSYAPLESGMVPGSAFQLNADQTVTTAATPYYIEVTAWTVTKDPFTENYQTAAETLKVTIPE